VAQAAGKINGPGRRNGRSIPRWLRNPAGAVLLLAAAIIVLSLYTTLRDIGQPFGGYVSYPVLGGRDSLVSAESPDWWPVVAAGLVAAGDDLLTIDDQPYTANARAVFARAYAAGRPVTVRVQRFATGETQSITIQPAPITVNDVVDVKLPELLVATAFWLLALLVLRAGPQIITNRVFAVAASLVAVHRATSQPALIGDLQPPLFLLYASLLIAAGLLGALAMHLATVFPTPLPRHPRRALIVAYAVGLASGLVLAATRHPWWARVPPELSEAIDNAAYLTMLLLLLMGIVALFARLIWSWIYERRTRRQRRAAAIVLAGMAGATPMFFFLLIPLVTDLSTVVGAHWRGLDMRYTLLAIPITFAVVIIRYQSFKALSSLFMLVLLLSLSGMLAAVGAWLWRLSLPPDATVTRPPFALLFTLILLSSAFWSAQVGRNRWFGRYLRWEATTYDAARSFGRRVMGQSDVRTLPGVLTQALVEEMALERAALWLRDDHAFALAGSAGDAADLPPRLTPTAGEPFPDRAMRSTLPGSVPGWLSPLAGEGRIEVVVPLVVDGVPLGVLGLGRRWDEAIFNDRDVAVAELVGQQATLLLQASMQLEELRRVPGQVAAAQERERLRVAGELHDTIQQFLGRLPFFLAVSRDRLRDDPQGAADILDRCLTDVEDAATMLRRIRVNLAPTQLESNLRYALEGLTGHVRQRSGLAVSLSAPPDLDDALTPQTRHALYRVIQQALDNTVAHAEASAATVTLAREDGRILFAVRDDGRGSSAETRQAAQQAGSFGLKSMATRLEMSGGALEFDSAPGAGTTVAGWVPAAGDRLSNVL
jgi:signal transduction histidine kinase